MIDFQPKLTKDFILANYSQESIFRLVFGKDVNTKDNYVSPFRADSIPKCKFAYKNGVLKFYDWADNLSLDAFGAVMKAYGVNFMGALEVIYKNQSPSLNFTKKVAQESYKKELRARCVNFTEEDFAWWTSFGINYTLVAEDQKAGRLLKGFEVYRKINPINFSKIPFEGSTYILRPTNAEGIKVYSPEDSLKWLSTLKRDDIFGYSELPESGDVVIVTSSYKDMLTLKSQFGLPCIAAQSESYFPEWLAKDLKSRFKTVILFYDLDSSGIKMANIHADLYGFKTMFVPENKKSRKDPSDFCKEYGGAWLRSGLNQFFDEWTKKVA